MRIEAIDGSRRDEIVDQLLGVEPYLTYRNFPPIGGASERLLEYHRQRFQTANEVLVALAENTAPLAAVAVAPRPFESQHFGLRMTKLDAPIAIPEDECRWRALAALYAAARDRLRASGQQHVAAQASANDRAAGWALQQIGAFYVGTKLSWMQSLTGRQLGPPLPSGLRYETYTHEEIAGIDPDRWRRLLAWCGTAFDRGPQVFDRYVPLAAAQGLYHEWTRRALHGEWADALLFVCDGDEFVAFHSMMLMEDLSRAAGERVVGRGIGASLPGYRGLFTALQLQSAATRPLGAAFLENEAQASTIPSIQVFGRLGHRCLHATASFHMRIDEPGPREG